MRKLTVILLVMVLLTGCSIGGRKTLKMGTAANFVPFEYIAVGDGGIVGKYDGIDIALAKIIADENNYELEITDIIFDRLSTELEAGRVDFVASAMSVTEERAKTLDFSVHYYDVTQVIVIRETDADKIKSAADLAGKTVGVLTSSTGHIACDQIEGIILKGYSKISETITALNYRHVDAAVIDSVSAKNYIRYMKGLTYIEDAEFFEEEKYAMAVKKGNSDLLKKINTTLEGLKSSGRIDEIIGEYIE